jgi:hypothetical protein
MTELGGSSLEFLFGVAPASSLGRGGCRPVDEVNMSNILGERERSEHTRVVP